MNNSALAYTRADTSWLARCHDYVELCKPRISVMVLLTVAVGGMAAGWGRSDVAMLVMAVVGTGCVATSASIWNQWLERESDRQMQRTRDRPLAAGRVTGCEAVSFSLLLVAGGMGLLLLNVGWRPATLALATWTLYIGVYTPLKRVTAGNTAVGAVAGALPVLIGWSASGQPWDARAAALFLLIFLWQFPHFMAIAWKYRRDYAAAGLQMATVTDPSGRTAGDWAVWGAAAVVPVSLVPAIWTESWVYFSIVICMGIIQMVLALDFARDRRDDAGRRLLRMSLIYLPTVLICVALIPLL